MAESWNKKQREKKKQLLKKEKEERRLERKEKPQSGNDWESMMAYIDENGNLSSTPPDPRKKVEIALEDIVLGAPPSSGDEPESKVFEGVVSFFNEEKGFGFIRQTGSQESIFVHISSLAEPVTEKDRVSFEISRGPKGLVATQVQVLR